MGGRAPNDNEIESNPKIMWESVRYRASYADNRSRQQYATSKIKHNWIKENGKLCGEMFAVDCQLYL